MPVFQKQNRTGWKAPVIRAALLLGALLMMVSLCGCSKTSGTAWVLATASPEDTVTQIYAEKFAEEVERLSDGEMRIEVFANSTLGGDRDLLESCADGDIPFVVQNTAPQVPFMKDLAVFDLPCAFDTIEQCRTAIDAPAFAQAIEEVYRQGGFELLGMADQGFRVMSTNKPAESVEDFAGQKIRTMENSYHLDFWSGLGASPAPMSFSEVYIGLQQHTIDAQENPYEVIVSNRLYEQQDYVVETNHLPHLITLITSESFFEGLTPQQQEILEQAAKTATAYAREQSDDRIAQRREVIEESGTQIVELSEQTRAQIREVSQSVYEAIEAEIDPEIYQAYVSGAAQ